MIDVNSVLDVVKFRFYQEWLYLRHLKDKPESMDRNQFIIEIVKKFFDDLKLPKNAAILDVSPYNGTFLDELKKREYDNYLGVSLSDKEINWCKEKGHKVVKYDFSWLPQHKGFNDESITYINCSQVLCTSPYPIFTLMEFNRILRYFGKVYIEVPVPTNTKTEYQLNHYSIFNDYQWITLFERTGFKVEKFETLGYDVKTEDDKSVREEFYCFLISKQKALDVK